MTMEAKEKVKYEKNMLDAYAEAVKRWNWTGDRIKCYASITCYEFALQEFAKNHQDLNDEEYLKELNVFKESWKDKNKNELSDTMSLYRFVRIMDTSFRDFKNLTKELVEHNAFCGYITKDHEEQQFTAEGWKDYFEIK